jgi:hypothetical protein
VGCPAKFCHVVKPFFSFSFSGAAVLCGCALSLVCLYARVRLGKKIAGEPNTDTTDTDRRHLRHHRVIDRFCFLFQFHLCYAYIHFTSCFVLPLRECLLFHVLGVGYGCCWCWCWCHSVTVRLKPFAFDLKLGPPPLEESISRRGCHRRRRYCQQPQRHLQYCQ